MLALSDKDALKHLAAAVASTLNLEAFSPATNRVQELALIAALPGASYLASMRELFDAPDYFSRSTKALILAAIDEMHEAGHATEISATSTLTHLKKSALATAAATAARACGWLPAELRHPDYALDTPKAPKSKSNRKANARDTARL